MAPRAHWKGFLKLSLVSCPIALYPAVAASERISFRQVNKRTGNRLRQQLVDEVTGELVKSEQKVRGYEVGEKQFLLVPDEELQAAEQEARHQPYSSVPQRPTVQHPTQSQIEKVAPSESPPISRLRTNARQRSVGEPQIPTVAEPGPIAPDLEETFPAPVPIENNRTIEIDRFIPRDQVDTRYLDTPYYVVPREEIGQEAFAVIRDAMRRKEVVGMGRVVLARRERPIFLEPAGIGIRGTTLRYSDEIRDEAEYFADIPPLRLPDEMFRVAEHIIATKTTNFDRAFLENRYRTVLISKLKEKHADLAKKAVEIRPPAENVISLMDILKRSLAREQPALGLTTKNTSGRRVSTKRSSSKRTRGRKAS